LSENMIGDEGSECIMKGLEVSWRRKRKKKTNKRAQNNTTLTEIELAKNEIRRSKAIGECLEVI